jgi:formimidoylglutamate deiminase
MAERVLHCQKVLLADGWRDGVCLHTDASGTITRVRPGPAPAGAERIAGAVVPGMPNLHSHGFQHLIAGLTGGQGQAADSFWGWRDAMYRLAAGITPQQFEACLAWVYLQMLQAGFTSCAEFHYLHHQPDGTPYQDPAEMSARVIAAGVAAGMPLTLLPVLYCRAGFGADAVEPHQRRYQHDVDAYLNLLDRCQALVDGARNCGLGVAPHSLRAVDPVALARVMDAAPTQWRKHIHIAEQPAEVEACLAQLGARPVDWLLDHQAVDDSWCLVHATHMLEAERERAAASGAVAGLCPSTEADLGDGMFEAAGWVQAGGRFGIGSDSNVRISVTEELRQLEYTERLRKGRRNVLAGASASCGRFLYAQAAASGGQALGQPVGRLAPGYRADMVELDTGHPLLAGRDGDVLLDTWIFAGGQDMIRSVWVAGARVIENGQHPAQALLEAGFRKAMAELS